MRTNIARLDERDRIASLRAFLVVARVLSFARAAEELNVSPSALSRRIAALEQDLRAQLLTRTTRRMALTETGRQFAEGMAPILGQLDRLEASVREQTTNVAGLLRVNLPATFGRSFVMPAIGDFLLRHPLLRVDATFQDVVSPALFDQADVTIQAGPPSQPDAVIRRLMRNQRILVASPTYLSRHPPIVRPQDLRAHNCLVLSRFAPLDVWELRQGDRLLNIHVTGSFRTNYGETLLQAAVQGIGIGLLSTFLVREALGAGSLIQVLPDWEHPASDIFAVIPPHRYVAEKVRIFIEHLRRALPRSE